MHLAVASEAVPDRLNRVEVETAFEVVTLTWDERTRLLAEMAHLNVLEPVRRAFEGAGTSRPVKIAPELEGAVIRVIETWGANTEGGLPALPGAVLELRDALRSGTALG